MHWVAEKLILFCILLDLFNIFFFLSNTYQRRGITGSYAAHTDYTAIATYYSKRASCFKVLKWHFGNSPCSSVHKTVKRLIVSHSLLWSHLVLLTVGVYSSNHRVLYTIGISMTRRFQKVWARPSVRPSACLSVCPLVALTKKAYSSIIDSTKIIRISGERIYHPLQENEEIFSKKYFSKILVWIFEKWLIIHQNACSSFIINSRIIIRIRWKGLTFSTRKWSDI